METITNPIIGDQTTFIRTAQQTNGEKTVLEISLAPKGGNALHKNFSHLALVFEMSQSELVGIFSLLGPILRYTAKRARENGVEKELIDKYCK